MASSKKILWIIFLTIFIDMLGIGILIPVFPILIAPNSAFKVTPANWSTAQNFIMAGWLMACFALAQFFCSPILGQLADRYGRRKILAISVSGTAISYILFAIAILNKNLTLMFISRAIDGISGGNISVAQAVIGDISEPKQRAKNFGLVGIALGLGFILGPFFGGKLSDPSVVRWFNAATPFYFTAIMSIFNVLLLLKFLPETLTTASNKLIDYNKPIHNISKALSYKYLKNIIPSVFLFNAGFTFFTTFWGIVLIEQFDFTQSGIGNFFAYMGFMTVLAQGLIVRKLSGKVAEYKVLNYSIIGTGICLLAYCLIPVNHLYWIYFIPPLMAIFIALTKAFSVALISRVTPMENLAEAMGVNSSASALANAIPAILAGYVASQHALLPIVVGGIITIIGGILFILIFKPTYYTN